MKETLQDEFHQAMMNSYRTAVKDCGYRAKAFLSMVAEMGAVQTARQLLSTKEVQSGMFYLDECGRLDLTVEALVAEASGGKFRELFDRELVREAERRLELFRSK